MTSVKGPRRQGTGTTGAGSGGAGSATMPGSQTLARGLTALQSVAATPGGLTVQQVADQIGVHRTIAYRLLATLAQFNLVARNEDGRYRPASGFFLLSAWPIRHQSGRIRSPGRLHHGDDLPGRGGRA